MGHQLSSQQPSSWLSGRKVQELPRHLSSLTVPLHVGRGPLSGWGLAELPPRLSAQSVAVTTDKYTHLVSKLGVHPLPPEPREGPQSPGCPQPARDSLALGGPLSPPFSQDVSLHLQLSDFIIMRLNDRFWKVELFCLKSLLLYALLAIVKLCAWCRKDAWLCEVALGCLARRAVIRNRGRCF